jgi:hypothetical protein
LLSDGVDQGAWVFRKVSAITSPDDEKREVARSCLRWRKTARMSYSPDWSAIRQTCSTRVFSGIYSNAYSIIHSQYSNLRLAGLQH